jgi:hypothetical protein
MEKEHIASEQIVECEICLKEVPLSAAKHDEVQDYVAHFCGIDCFAKWKEQHEQQQQQK